MATTAIWSIKGGISKAIVYIENPDKTINPNYLAGAGLTETEAADIKRAITYATQSKKVSADNALTGTKQFVTGIECLPKTAAIEMQAVKRHFGKEDGITAYHAYQSFKPGEVTAEEAHQIGVEFAREIWGDRFQVVVATHVDKGHTHNHFIVNSVSFIDGKKYNGCKTTYRQIRSVSDKLCREHGLSVVESGEPGKAMKYAEWKADHDGKATWRSLIKDDVDRAIKESMTDREFFSRLQAQGYDIKTGKDISVRPPGKERYFRLARNYGQDYTIQAIRRKILSQDDPIPPLRKKPMPKRTDTVYNLSSKPKRKISGLYGLYLHYRFLLGNLPRGSPNTYAQVHFLLREDIQKLDKLTSEMGLLRRNKIQTAKQLLSYKEGIEEKIGVLSEERTKLRKQLRRTEAIGHEEEIKSNIYDLTGDIHSLRREIKLCDDIADRSGVIREKIHTLQQQNQIQDKEEKEYGQFRGSR